MRAFLGRARPWLAPAAVALLLWAALPPAGTYARYLESAQALQFVIFAVAGPALLILSRPRAGDLVFFRRLSDWAGPRARRAPAGRAAAAKLLAFIALVITWRLPAARNALAADPVLVLAELVTLAAAGGSLAELAGPGRPRQPLSRPLRAAMAAAAMWTIWIIAYITGLFHASQTAAHGGTAGAPSVAADQQIAIAIMWAVPAICFVPVIYAMVISWLGEREDPARQSANTPPAGGARPRPRPRSVSMPRPPRGWRSPEEMRRIIQEEEPAKPSTRLSTMGAAATLVSARRRNDPKGLSQLFRGELDWIVMRAWKRRGPALRDGRRLRRRHRALPARRPVLACPPSTWYRFRKVARRHKMGLLSAMVVTLALVAGTAQPRQAILATEAATSKQQALTELEKEQQATRQALRNLGEEQKSTRRSWGARKKPRRKPPWSCSSRWWPRPAPIA